MCFAWLVIYNFLLLSFYLYTINIILLFLLLTHRCVIDACLFKALQKKGHN